MMKKTLVAALFAVAAVGAQAALTGGVAANQNPASFIDLSAAGVVAGGALYTANALPNAAIPLNTAPPKNTVGTWLAAGPDNNNNSAGGIAADAVVDFGAGTSFVSFLWGSPDPYNTLTVTLMDNSMQSFASADFPTIVFNGNQGFASYIGFTATDGDLIKSLTFASPNQNAFEASNFSVTTPVPEPETYALMLAGLAAVGFVARRRRKA